MRRANFRFGDMISSISYKRLNTEEDATVILNMMKHANSK